MFVDNLQSKRIFKPDEINTMIELSMNDVEIVKKRQYKKPTIYYFNCACAFDIETTSFINAHGEKAATMYVWMLGLNGFCMMGRTWQDFIQKVTKIYDWLKERNPIIEESGYKYEALQKISEYVSQGNLSESAIKRRMSKWIKKTYEEEQRKRIIDTSNFFDVTEDEE